MDYLLAFTKIHALQCWVHEGIHYVETHPEEFLFNPEKQFSKTDEDASLSFKNVFEVVYKLAAESIEVFGEEKTETGKEFFEPDFCIKRQFIRAAAYIYVFASLNRAMRRFLTFHGKHVLGVDGSDQVIYGAALSAEQKEKLKLISELADSFLKNGKIYELNPEALNKKVHELADYLKSEDFNDEVIQPMLDELNRIGQAEVIQSGDLKKLSEICQSLVNLAKKKQDPFLITYKNGNTRHAVHVNTMFDLIEHIFLDFVLQPGATINEDAALIELVHNLKLNPADCIIAADRGYQCWMTFYLLNALKTFFVIRIKDIQDAKSFLGDLELTPNGELDKVVKVRLVRDGKVAIHRKNNFDGIVKKVQNADKYEEFKDHEYLDIEIRVVRFQVVSPDGKVSWQTVVTNLPADEYSLEDIKEVYRLRWQIEESLKALKLQFDFSSIHARKLLTIQHELYAKATLYNLTSMIRLIAEDCEDLGMFCPQPAGLLEWHGQPETENVCQVQETPDEKNDSAEKADESEQEFPEIETTASKTSDFIDNQAAEPESKGLSRKYQARKAFFQSMKDLQCLRKWEHCPDTGVEFIDVDIHPDKVWNRTDGRYALKLNFSVLAGIVRKHLFSNDPASSLMILERCLGHTIQMKIDRPDTRTKYMARKIAKARGQDHHPDTRMSKDQVT